MPDHTLPDRLRAAANLPIAEHIARLLQEAADALALVINDDSPACDGFGFVRCGCCNARLATYEPCEECNLERLASV